MTVAGTARSGLTEGRGRGRNVLGVSSIGCSTGRNRSWDRGSGFKNKIQTKVGPAVADKGCEQMPQPDLAAAKPWLCHQPRGAFGSLLLLPVAAELHSLLHDALLCSASVGLLCFHVLSILSFCSLVFPPYIFSMRDSTSGE